jgi:hypothetical protein
LQTQLLIEQVSQLQTQIHRVEQAIEQQTTFNQQVRRLLKVPGLGLVGAWTILAEIGDITRFQTAGGDKFDGPSRSCLLLPSNRYEFITHCPCLLPDYSLGRGKTDPNVESCRLFRPPLRR